MLVLSLSAPASFIKKKKNPSHCFAEFVLVLALGVLMTAYSHWGNWLCDYRTHLCPHTFTPSASPGPKQEPHARILPLQ